MVGRLGVSRMTAYRMARTLQGTGHLVHDPASSRYHLGPAMLAGTYLLEGFAPTVQLAHRVSRVARGADRRARGSGCGDRRCRRLRRPRGLGPALRARDRRGAGHRRHRQCAWQDVRGDEVRRRAYADRQEAAPAAHAGDDHRPRGPRHGTQEDPATRSWPSTSKSTTWAHAPSWPRCSTRPARSSRRWASWSPRVASAPRRERPAPKWSGLRPARSPSTSGTRARPRTRRSLDSLMRGREEPLAACSAAGGHLRRVVEPVRSTILVHLTTYPCQHTILQYHIDTPSGPRRAGSRDRSETRGSTP